MIEQLKQTITEQPRVQQLLKRVNQLQASESLALTGVVGSLRSFVLTALAEDLSKQILIVAPDEDAAEKCRDDFNLVVGRSRVTLFGRSNHHAHVDDTSATSVEDVETLRALMDGSASIIITHATALSSHIPNPASLQQQVFKIEIGKEYDFKKLQAQLAGFGFEKQQFVASVGDYSVRGGILDVFPFVGENPVRIEFFGDTVESIREFEAISQRSIKELVAASIVPDLLASSRSSSDLTPSPSPKRTGELDNENVNELIHPSPFGRGDGGEGKSDTAKRAIRSTLLDFLNPNALLVLDEPELLKKTLDERFDSAQRDGESLRSWEGLLELFALFPQIHLSLFDGVHPERSRRAQGDAKRIIDFNSTSQPSINGSIKILRAHLVELQSKDFAIFITCDTQSEQERLRNLLAELEPIAEEEEQEQYPERSRRTEHHLDVSKLQFSLDAFHEGFVLPDAKLALFTEHQIFNRLKRRGKQRRAKFKGITARELHELRKGDYVVHSEFGIGRYDGLKKINVRDVEQEVVKLLYEEKDTLYVNLNYLNKIQKYASKEGHVPKLTRLGSGEWEKLKARTKKRVKDIARDLIRLYAKRKQAQGHAFDKDTLWQRELEASFMYEDTPDQAKSTEEVKQDMEAPFPMDRLVCGDVGFGKTEVAVRAAFKSVMSGKQAALLVPTTILAQQHYNTFLDRLSKYSTRVEVISRFKTKKEQTAIIERLKSGATDIVIGTHRLLSKDVGFKDLGLLIIDEEHRFGVAAKEKLRQFKANVDTLTLTATPIPRTLHFSLMGARDLSIIATPPRNRIPIITEIAQYNEEHIREAILREIHRGGQVFFVHDRVHNMDEEIARLQKILPHARIRYAHGQMHAHELEDVMLAFLERKFDVLVATKIIESGLDIPSVNTIIINRADRFGMAELYQLRGRVGRSNVQAYAHLLTPPISVLPRETVRRLQAIEEFTELGSGFNLAMRDLEIRGAGNLLGGEQSGFIESMGFEMYTRILEEAVAELKEQEFQDLFEKEIGKRREESQTLVEADFDVHIPESFIENDNERLAIYRRLFAVTTNEQLEEISSELTDRFGKHPDEVANLLNLVRVRLKASKLGFRKVNISTDGVMIEFPPESETPFYEAESFQLLMTFISQKKNKRMALRQNGKTLVLACSFENGETNSFNGTESLLDELESAVTSNEIESVSM
jgi:transcription-repair coupling factor (superfamily II helicase)